MLLRPLKCSPRTTTFRIPLHFHSTATQATRVFNNTVKLRIPAKIRTIVTIPKTTKPVPYLVLQAANKRSIAERILQEGREYIYKSPSHVGFLVAAWMISGSGIMCCMYFFNSGFLNEEEMKARGLTWWVSPAYKSVFAFMGLCSGVLLAQSFSFITAIKIVKDRAGVTKLLVKQRPWFPLWRQHQYLIEPAQLQIDRRVAYLARHPDAAKTDVGRQATEANEGGSFLKKIVLSPFLIVRKLFFHEAVLKVQIPTKPDGSKNTWLRLDLDGHISNNGQDLLDVATIKD